MCRQKNYLPSFIKKKNVLKLKTEMDVLKKKSCVLIKYSGNEEKSIKQLKFKIHCPIRTGVKCYYKKHPHHCHQKHCCTLIYKGNKVQKKKIQMQSS